MKLHRHLHASFPEPFADSCEGHSSECYVNDKKANGRQETKSEKDLRVKRDKTTDSSPPTAQEVPLAATEEVIESDAEMWFGDQAAHFGIDAFAKKHGMSALQLRNHVKVRVHPSWSTKRLSSVFGRSMAIGGFGLYVHAVVQAFTTNTTIMDKIAAVTAIVPLVGCGTQAVAVNLRNQANQIAAVETYLCLLGDGLIFTSLWPLGIAVHVLRAVIAVVADAVAFMHSVEPSELQMARLRGWRQICEAARRKLTSEETKAGWNTVLRSQEAAIVALAAEAVALLDVAANRLQLNATDAERILIAQNRSIGLRSIEKTMCESMRTKREQLRWEQRQMMGLRMHNTAVIYDQEFRNSVATRFQWTIQFPGWMSWKEISRRIEEGRQKIHLPSTSSAKALQSIIDDFFGPQWAPVRGCSWSGELQTSSRSSVTAEQGVDTPGLTPDKTCIESCKKLNRETETFDEIHHEGKGVFGCVARTERGMALWERAPACCPFQEMKLQDVSVGINRQLRRRCVTPNFKPSPAASAPSKLTSIPSVSSPTSRPKLPWRWGEDEIEDGNGCLEDHHQGPNCEKYIGTEIYCARQTDTQACLSQRKAPVFVAGDTRCKNIDIWTRTTENCVGTLKWCGSYMLKNEDLIISHHALEDVAMMKLE
ncbi:hypothetical protein CDD80_1565 [Ophiocordyceps camponoti-rufipedis]|uniref:Uncharacterized protein n=1 Tax=Ophiocordyceps camponoti-rufipedis TaxID=2004952 RepID=A0A2C5Z934_9HYPO|nr:hypothetical protein CDD80_1565 [Ophiocordyceps camponoti-rufipedis]